MPNGTHAKTLAPERWNALRAKLDSQGVVRVDDLVQELEVSAATIRRDLEELERMNLLRRVHGGAVRLESRLHELRFDDKAGLHPEEKRRIAAAAAGIIQDRETVYLDGGSTVVALASLLRGRETLTVVTNSLRAAVELSAQGPRLILIGGELRRRSQSLVGSLTRHVLSELHVDRAFMGTIGLTRQGLSTTDPDEAFTKALVMAQAAEVTLLAVAEKIGTQSFAQAGAWDQVDRFITSGGADPAFLKFLKQRRIHVTLV